MTLELKNYKNEFSFRTKFARLIWSITWKVLSVLLPRNSGGLLKYVVLRLFGAKIHRTSTIYSRVKIYQPWKLKMGEYSTLAENVDCYNVDWVVIGE
jgi:putative colanic acid biosynthesis acetyltransferase WcaF